MPACAWPNWLRLKDRSTGREFRVVNTHLDHVSQVARKNGARVICEDAVAYGETYPQLLTGDMNCDTDNEAIEIFRAAGWIDTYEAVCATADPGHSFHAFQGPEYEGEIGKMDWVFWLGAVEVQAAEIVDEHCDGRFPSDHYFVTADIEI